MNDDSKSPRNLDRLLGNIVKYVSDDVRGKIQRRRKPVEHTVPRKMCKICLKSFDFITVKINAERTVEGAVCPDCRKELDRGKTACCYANNPGAFILMPLKDKDMHGQILQVTREVWEAIQAKVAKKKSNGNGGVHAD